MAAAASVSTAPTSPGLLAMQKAFTVFNAKIKIRF
jgi:hypothetical protein